ncbi:MAG: diaminopimelate epimerase [Chloroflexota bacterium]|nr:diaminopimelate epimerase [Chloroflexota bacterium]
MENFIPFAKMSGSGNDFVVIDHRERLLAEDEIASFTRAVCRRGMGLGADGVILIERATSPSVHFRWRYFNADGSVGGMCGNGAMCGARFAVRQGIAPASCRFETEAGVVEAEVSGAGHSPAVAIRLAEAELPGAPVTISIEGRTNSFAPILVGVPHVVTVVKDTGAFADGAEFVRWSRAVRMHETFAPAGTNVNAIHVIDRHTIRMRTYERGVEAETLACGTGAVASAVVAAVAGLVTQPVAVMVSSGRTLTVQFSTRLDRIADIRLTGEAWFVAGGVLDPEGLA